MGVTVEYDSLQRLQLSGLACDCACSHETPTQDIYVGQSLLGRLPEMMQRRGLGGDVLLVCDQNTYRVAGEQVEQILGEAGFRVRLCRVMRTQDMEPDERAVGEVLLSMLPETQVLLSVGSGSVTDITRVVATRTDKAFVCVGTAPSMDGYTSVVAPLLLRGAKIHRQGRCPELIVCDLDVLRTAPPEMFAAGVGDVLGKYIAKADWVIGHLIHDEPYCPVCGDIVISAVGRLLNHIPEIRSRSIVGTRILIEALLLSGMTIMVVGHTRAVASVEHNIAHYWEMQTLARGEKPPSHGLSVGVATRLIWPLFERYAREPLAVSAKETVKERSISKAQREDWMLEAFGPDTGAQIMAENPEDFLSWQEQERRIDRALERDREIKQELSLLPPLGRIEEAMAALGAPMEAAELGIGEDLLALSMRCAKDYRSRYTLLKLLDETGLLERYLEEAGL